MWLVTLRWSNLNRLARVDNLSGECISTIKNYWGYYSMITITRIFLLAKNLTHAVILSRRELWHVFWASPRSFGYFWQGVIFSIFKKNKQAINSATRAIQLYPQNWLAYAL